MTSTATAPAGGFSVKLLGGIALIGAPMLLLSFLLGATDSDKPKTITDQLISITGVLYMIGWIAGAIGMRELRLIGQGIGSKVVFVVQVALLGMGLIFSVMETMGYSTVNGGLVFKITDVGYPLGHLWMIVVGITVLLAKTWSGPSKFAPLLVGVALPVSVLLGIRTGSGVGLILFGIMTMVGFGIIGFTLIRRA